MKGVWMGMFALNVFMFAINIEALGAGAVGVALPLLNVGAALLCLYCWKTSDGN